MITKKTRSKKEKKVKAKTQKDTLEEKFEKCLLDHKIEYIREFVFIPGRRFRSDFYLPKWNLLIEIEGGIFKKGRGKSRHTTPLGYHRDCIKYSLATMLGYRLIRLTTVNFMNPKIENKEETYKIIVKFISTLNPLWENVSNKCLELCETLLNQVKELETPKKKTLKSKAKSLLNDLD